MSLNTSISGHRYDFIIIGGSYAGLSAALTLARACRSVLIIDHERPCNQMVDHSHNFLSRDGEPPQAISRASWEQVQAYPTVRRITAEAAGAEVQDNEVRVTIQTGEDFFAAKILFATGLTDIMPGIAGFAECWGNTILHCPYCHGYEVKNQKIAVTANGDHAYHLCLLLHNLSKDLTLFTNGKSELSADHLSVLLKLNIPILEEPIKSIIHRGNQMSGLTLTNGESFQFKAMFAKVLLQQQCTLPEQLGCRFNQHLIEVDDCQRTSVRHVYAAGDNCRLPRTISLAVAAGTQAGFMMNWDLLEESLG